MECGSPVGNKGACMGATDSEVTLQQIEDTLRFNNGLVELRFDRSNGTWRELIDCRDDRAVLHGGGIDAPVLLSVGGRTQASRGYNQIFTVADTETIGLHWQFEGADF